MKLCNIALLATTALSLETFELKITSSNSELNGKGLQSLHKGAGISVFGIADSHSDKYLYDAEQKKLFQYQGEYEANVGIGGKFLMIGSALNPGEVTFDSEGNFNIGKDLYACKNVTDVYNWFTDKYGILAGEAPNETCVGVGLKKATGGSSA